MEDAFILAGICKKNNKHKRDEFRSDISGVKSNVKRTLSPQGLMHPMGQGLMMKVLKPKKSKLESSELYNFTNFTSIAVYRRYRVINI